MKVFALCFLIGCALAGPSEWRWQTGKEYEFEYSGRLLSGFPRLSSHYSGLGINATVIVQVVGQEKLQLHLTNPKYVQVSQKLQQHSSSMDGPDGVNWRELHLPEMTGVDPAAQAILKTPIVFTFSSGEIVEVSVSKREPEWSVNFKKALAILFQAKVDTTAWETENNKVISPLTEGLNYWKAREETMDGLCENTYQINELPKYIVRDQPYLVPRPDLCPEQKYYEITKVRNIESCEKKSSFSFYKPGHFGCSGPSCKNLWARTVQVRFIACGSRVPGGLTVQSVYSNWELNQLVLGFKNEPLVSGNLQVLSLKDVRTAAPAPQPADLVKLNSLMYEYTSKAYQQSQHDKNVPRVPNDIVKQPEELAKAFPQNYLQAKMHQNVNKQAIVQQLEQLIPEIVDQMHSPLEQQVSEKTVTMKVLAVARGLSILGRPELQQLYATLKQKVQPVDILKDVFFDSAIIAGTPETIIFVKEQIVKGEITMKQAMALFVMLPNSLVVPTEQVLNELFDLVKSHWVQECPYTKRVAYISFSSLLEKACLAPNRRSAYPTYVFGEFCHPESPIVAQQWLPHLFEQLESASIPNADLNDIIVNVGTLPLKAVVNKLIPFVEGKTASGKPVPRLTRMLAIWSIASAGKNVEPEIVRDIALAIYSNPVEATEIRIAAFNVLLKLNPPMTVFQQIAARTLTEQDTEVLKVVQTALYSLKLQHEQSEQPHTPYSKLALKANHIYPLIKKVQGFAPTSASIYTSDYLPRLGVGYEGLTSWIASNSSFLPVETYVEMRYYLDQYQFKPIAMGYRFEGIQNVYRKIAELLIPLKNGQSAAQQREEMANEMRNKVHSEWRKIVEKLRIEPRDSQDISGSLYLRMFESTPLFLNFEQVTLDYFKDTYLRNPLQLKSKLAGKTPFKYQRIVNFAPTQVLIPTEMGFPVTIEFSMPVAFSLQGSAELSLNAQKPSFKATTKVSFTSHYTARVGTTIPFTEQFAVASIDNVRTVNLPAELTVEIDVPNHHLKMAVSADKQVTRATDIVYHSTKPSTLLQKVDHLAPTAAHITPIRSENAPKVLSVAFGQDYGLDMTSQLETEAPYIDRQSLIDRLSAMNYNPLNLLRFTFSPMTLDKYGQLSIRRNTYRLRYNPQQSVHKEISLDIKIGYAVKAGRSAEFVYKKIELAKDIEWAKTGPVMKAIQELYPISVKQQPVELAQIHPDRQASIAKAIEPVKTMETGRAIVVKFAASIPGPRPLTWSHVATLALGQQQLPAEMKYTSKWNFVAVSKTTGSELQIDGKADIPILPLWNENELRSSLIDLTYHNRIQYKPAGQTPWSVQVNGNAKTSYKQKEFSRTSVEAIACEKQKAEPGLSLGKLSPACEVARRQASSLDEIDFTVNYVNVPVIVQRYEGYFLRQLKALLWPFHSSEVATGSQSGGNDRVLFRFLLHQTRPSFDLVVSRAQEKMSFENIRLPYPYSLLVPVSPAPVMLVSEEPGLSSYYTQTPVCKVSGRTLQTFDNRTIPFQVDRCYHLVAADCSSDLTFSVLTNRAKILPTSDTVLSSPADVGFIRRRELAVFLGGHLIKFVPVTVRSFPVGWKSVVKVTMDNVQISLDPGRWVELNATSTTALAKIHRSINDVYRLKAADYGVDVTYDGYDFAIETTAWDKSNICGICGNQNSQPRDDIAGPRQCQFSEPAVEIAAYRYPMLPMSCDLEAPLPPAIKEKLYNEQSTCAKSVQLPTKILPVVPPQASQCMKLRHAVIFRADQICFSKRPVVQCSSGCLPASGKLVEKVMQFACMGKDRVAEHYVKKANEGQKLPEMESRPTAFESRLPQPKSCLPASNEL